jgi:glycosyltransferase involved in cell wall biosynthesis
MGRAHDLKQTMLQNIANNISYPNVEFVLLNYNSRDDLDQWVERHLMADIEVGRVVYAKTTEPEFYHMAHSRNVALKLATGDIVCNLDADNWTGPGFAQKLNRLANEQPERAVFTKSRQLIRGRIAFYKREWSDVLGGYDEDLNGYGFDDMDLMHRALLQDFRLMLFGGEHVMRIKTEGEKRVINMPEKKWRQTEKRNEAISASKIQQGLLKSNEGRAWGRATVVKNFCQIIEL